ncbi:MAG: hypothetical protein HGA43_08570 [Nitrospirae bacterium]|nr:hypothetical protein [Nitrospirota bacterium]
MHIPAVSQSMLEFMNPRIVSLCIEVQGSSYQDPPVFWPIDRVPTVRSQP